jgi:UDP-N-acetylmuramoyl-tripeptide--D-alanyl-D-alanine ligase
MWASDFLAKACNASVIGPSVTFSSVSIDTRTVTAGALFVALRGETFDGHHFIEQAIVAGALGVVVSKPVALPSHIMVITVPDTLAALQQMGHAARMAFSGPVIAVTGSNGKTTTKQFIASVLQQHYGSSAVLATQGNLNNHIGVPLTLLRLRKTHEVAVIEMGMNHFNEIAMLSELTQPTIAVITNAGPAHLEGVGSIEGVAAAKGEIFNGLRAGGTAILNADDYFLPYWQVLSRTYALVTFALNQTADITGAYEASGATLNLALSPTAAPCAIQLPFAGEHNARNALAAAAVAHVLGVSTHEISVGLECASNLGGRLARRTLANGVTLIDDSYNANPASMRAAAQVLLAEPGPKIMVIGDMAEIGPRSDGMHQALLADFSRQPFAIVLTLGERMQRAALALAISSDRIVSFTDIDALASELKARLSPGTAMLVKGSRSMAMERVIEKLEPTYKEAH